MTDTLATMSRRVGTRAPMFDARLGLLVASFAWSRVRKHRRT